jgi:O-6-methylguanine DNA methyltransferase
MTERLRRALDDYRDRTRATASTEFTSRTLDRLGLADRYALIEDAPFPAIRKVYVAWNPHGVSALREAQDAESFERWFRKRFGRRALPSSDRPAIVELVRRALAGADVEVDVDLRDCTPFETMVLRKAREIPRGHARPYAWIAREIDHPRAVRAVGSALANNPVPLLIPCHRVVRSDYSCGDYVFGSEKKRALLEGEGLHLKEIQELARHGIRYIGLPEDNCFCMPTCGTDVIANMKANHLPQFHTVEEALARGLEPCGVCRPIAA